jgi:hypothetical protein
VALETVKRPFMRHPPCAVECRCDGNQVYALIGEQPTGCIGYGDTLADALRALADEIEKEVGQANPYNSAMLQSLAEELWRVKRTGELPTEDDMDRIYAILAAV